MARDSVLPTPVKSDADRSQPGTPLLSVVVSGPPVTLNNQAAQMPFINQPPQQPVFLDGHRRSRNCVGTTTASKTLIFDSKAPGARPAHDQRHPVLDNLANVRVQLGAVEEWTIKNTTNPNRSGLIDHPFHIHINPFQITEFFDPNENMTDPRPVSWSAT